MKRTYSVILLLSFLVGALQPIMPMVEYQLHTGSLLEFFDSEKPCDNFVQLLKDDCGPQQEDSEDSLLDVDYYPLALNITTLPKPIVFPNKQKLEILINKDVRSRPFSPSPPPPKLS